MSDIEIYRQLLKDSLILKSGASRLEQPSRPVSTRLHW
jgi:hypothetical protein